MLDGNSFFIVASTGLSSSEDNHLYSHHSLGSFIAANASFSPLLMQYAWSDAALCMGNLSVSTGTGNLFSGGCLHFKDWEHHEPLPDH